MVTTTTAWMALPAGFLSSAAANVFPSKFKLRTILPHSSVGFPTESVYVIAASLALSLNNFLYQMSLRYNPARAIPMKWGAVYMGVFMAFWGLCKIILTCPSPDDSPSSIVHIAFRLYSQPIPGKAAYDIGLWREVEVSSGVIFTEWKRTKSKWSCKDQINISGTEKHSLYQLPMALRFYKSATF